MIGLRYLLMRVDVYTSVVLYHIFVEQFLIGNLPVVGQMIAQCHELWRHAVLTLVR